MKIWTGATILGLVFAAWSVEPASASDAGWRHGHHKYHGHHQTRRHHDPRRHHGYHHNEYESRVDGCRYRYKETWRGYKEVLVCRQVAAHDHGPPPWARNGRWLEQAPSHETIAWRDQENGVDYRVTPQPGYRNRDGAYCREYQTMATIGGRMESAYGTACRQPDGSWRLVN